MSRLLTHLQIPHHLMDDQDRDEALLAQAEVVIATPGISPTHHSLYAHFGHKVISELTFLGRYREDMGMSRDRTCVIAITGTKGKSTTTWMTSHLVAHLLEPQGRQVHLSGNI